MLMSSTTTFLTSGHSIIITRSAHICTFAPVAWYPIMIDRYYTSSLVSFASFLLHCKYSGVELFLFLFFVPNLRGCHAKIFSTRRCIRPISGYGTQFGLGGSVLHTSPLKISVDAINFLELLQPLRIKWSDHSIIAMCKKSHFWIPRRAMTWSRYDSNHHRNLSSLAWWRSDTPRRQSGPWYMGKIWVWTVVWFCPTWSIPYHANPS